LWCPSRLVVGCLFLWHIVQMILVRRKNVYSNVWGLLHKA